MTAKDIKNQIEALQKEIREGNSKIKETELEYQIAELQAILEDLNNQNDITTT